MTRRTLLSLVAAAPYSELDALLADSARKLNAPSLSAAVVHNGKLLWTGATGYADLENRTLATTASIYRYASISKPITAALILRLAEQKLLDLDAPAISICPALKSLRWSPTARQLLGHMGGIRHYRDRDEARNIVHYSKLSQALASILPDAQIHEPGTRYLYSTRGFTILGAIAEQSTGTPFHQLLNKQILQPSGMTKTRLDHSYEIIPNRVRGYFRSQNNETRNAEYQDTSVIQPGGGLCGTAEDLARFAIAILNGTLLKHQTCDAMWTPQQTASGQLSSYGLGWYVAGDRAWHGGAQGGARGLLLLHPKHQTCVALLTNLESAELRQLAKAIFSHLNVTWLNI